MSILSTLQYPDLKLKTKARCISKEELKTKKIQKLINDMLETLAVAKNCAALAATQLAIENPPSITVINPEVIVTPPLPKKPLCLVNPEIIVKGGEQSSQEGCMSIYPDNISAKVTRAKKVTVAALDRKGNDLKIEADGFFAKCLQHEIDHLNGMIYLDRLSFLKRSSIEKKINKLQKKK